MVDKLLEDQKIEIETANEEINRLKTELKLVQKTKNVRILNFLHILKILGILFRSANFKTKINK